MLITIVDKSDTVLLSFETPATEDDLLAAAKITAQDLELGPWDELLDQDKDAIKAGVRDQWRENGWLKTDK